MGPKGTMWVKIALGNRTKLVAEQEVICLAGERDPRS